MTASREFEIMATSASAPLTNPVLAVIVVTRRSGPTTASRRKVASTHPAAVTLDHPDTVATTAGPAYGSDAVAGRIPAARPHLRLILGANQVG